jgi:hypothetical protein
MRPGEGIAWLAGQLTESITNSSFPQRRKDAKNLEVNLARHAQLDLVIIVLDFLCLFAPLRETAC